MSRFLLAVVGVLAVLTAAKAAAQTAGPRADDNSTAALGAGSYAGAGALSEQIEPGPVIDRFSVQRLPSVDLSPHAPPPEGLPAGAGGTLLTQSFGGEPLTGNAPTHLEGSVNRDGSVNLDGAVSLDGKEQTEPIATLSDFMGYRYSSSSLDWMPGNGNQFGMFSIRSDHYQESGIRHGIDLAAEFHSLSGPVQTDMPAWVFDFSVGYQFRGQLGSLRYDLCAAVLVASDFKGDASEGIMYPSHAVGFLALSPTMDLVFGVDYVDRGDVKLLPVGGLIWMPNPNMRFELVFPRPRAVFQLSDGYRLYVAGELGGGTWAIERELTFTDDLATYHDLRICLGLESVEKHGQTSAIEIAYLFDRRLQYTSGIRNMNLDDSVMIRWVTRH
jgi:hypothetical protein